MMPQINHILYATDLSENSVYAFRYALNSTMKHNAKITILHALEPLPATANLLTESMLSAEKFQELRNENRSYILDRLHTRLKSFYEKEMPDDSECQVRIASILVTEGLPADEILRKADELDCDAIIMGFHGNDVMANTFLGSTTMQVLHNTQLYGTLNWKL